MPKPTKRQVAVGLVLFKVALLAGCAMLAGCALIPDLGAKPELPAAAKYETARSFDAGAAPMTWPADTWWTVYGNADLTALIDEALAGSPTLAVAAARVQASAAAAQQAGASRLPSVGTQNSVTVSRTDISADNLPAQIAGVLPNDFTLGTSAATRLEYQLDFFGKNRAAIAAATSRARAAGMEAAAARLQLSTAVALAYADFIRFTADRDAAAETVRLRGESADLVRQRHANGLENEGLVHQSEAELARAKADLAAADGAIARVRNQLAALLGKGPDRGLDIKTPGKVTLQTAGLPAKLGLELMGRRPDLAAARARAEAAAKQIDMAQADFYPNVNLTAVAGLQTLGLSQIGGGTVAYGQFGPAMTLPIFTGGRLEGAYRGARAGYDEAVASYDQAVTTALKEVADVIADRRTLEERLKETRAALKSADAAYVVARLRYRGGVSAYLDLLAAENTLVASRTAVADLQTQAFAIDVALVRALGGGFTQI